MSRLPASTAVGEMVGVFMALANETRLLLMLVLIDNADESELCVCDLARVAGASPSMTSHQLRILRESGLVAFRRQGKRILYRCAASHVSHLILDARQHVQTPPGEC